MSATPTTLPAYGLSHGGGPWPWIKDSFMGDWSILERSLQAIPAEIGTTPTAIVCVTAHWIEPRFAVSLDPNPGMIYDYFGFPQHTYDVVYPASGAPDVAQHVVELARVAGLDVDLHERRGYDHGTFVPLAVAFPDANIPVVQVSIRRDFDAAAHISFGRALSPLRQQGVLIVGSGVPTFHDLRSFGPASVAPSRAFDQWLTDTVVGHVGDGRAERLVNWAAAPGARESHPMPDHLMPLLVAAGAAYDDAGHVQYHEDTFMGYTASSGYRFGLYSLANR